VNDLNTRIIESLIAVHGIDFPSRRKHSSFYTRSMARRIEYITLVYGHSSQLNSTQPEITDAGVNTSMSASLCTYFLRKNIINLLTY